MTAPTTEQLATALGRCQALVAGVRPEQWSAPTPCTDWDVRALVGHLVLGSRVFAGALQGRPADRDTLLRLQAEDPLGEDPAGAQRAADDALLASFRAPGALEQPVTVPFGTVPAVVALHLRITEALVHGWDLARATGQQPPADDPLVEQELAFTAAQLRGGAQVRQRFAEPQPVPDGAPPLDRLAALLGRTV